MKIQKRIEITKRGYALLNKYVPGLVRAKTIAAVLETLSPFVTVWFSARIINELMNDRRQNVLVLYVILVIGIHLLFSMISIRRRSTKDCFGQSSLQRYAYDYS